MFGPLETFNVPQLYSFGAWGRHGTISYWAAGAQHCRERCRAAVLPAALTHGRLNLSEFAQTNFPACARGAVSEGRLVHRNLVRVHQAVCYPGMWAETEAQLCTLTDEKRQSCPKALDMEVHLASNPELTGLADSQGRLDSCLCSEQKEDPSPCYWCAPKEQIWYPGAGRRRIHVK